MYGVLRQNMTCTGNLHESTGPDKFKCFIIVVVMTLIIVGNVCCIVVFNHPLSKRFFMKRVRYMMTSLSCSDLGIGLLVCPSSIYPSLYHCWPFGDVFCRIEALLISALFHESSLNMVLIAVDRYCIVHLRWYNSYMSSERFLKLIISTWIVVFTCYSFVIFAGGQYYYDEFGINCEPFYENEKVTLSVISIFYFLPAFLFVFSYMSIYRTACKRKMLTISGADKHGRMVSANIRTSKYLAAITAGFFVAISPWTLTTLIIVAEKISINIHLDFTVTWLALSNSFLNCLIYGAMNRKFRRAAKKFACGFQVKLQTETTDKSTEDFSTVGESTYSRYKQRSVQKMRQRYMETSVSGASPQTDRSVKETVIM
ncbi:GPR21-like protein [Mya arenaria]|uniref:GPR21-like protein n=1 Tax=Mya arenaria TaxID=6604 RepID=A0ABY7FI67_MYAAR|nr:probable G-protein coupled receptor 21 [Mya arenaria]WAR21868.1 GPR21-like protein [Mya arenaria]